MKKIAIIGAGISGLFIANLFKRNSNYQITIFEKNNLIDLDEGYGVQLSVNSIKLLNEIKFDELLSDEKFNPSKIKFYSEKSSKLICELDISNFNNEKCKYTTLKRSTLINFLKKNLENTIKTDHSISRIDQLNQSIQLTFENDKKFECDYLIVSDGVFSKSKKLIFNNKSQPKYNKTLAIRGLLPKSLKLFDYNNISLFLGSNFHYVIYPVSPNGDLNFIAIMKYSMSNHEQNNYSLFSEDTFIKKILKKLSDKNIKFLNNLVKLKIFPVFVSEDFYKSKNDNIHFIGDAFYAFPPSFAQGASQSIEGAYELFKNIENNSQRNFFRNRVNKTKMVNRRSIFSQFAFHFSSPIAVFLRDIFLKRLVKNKIFLDSFLGRIYKN